MSAFDIVSGVIGGCVGVCIVWAVVRELLNTKPPTGGKDS